MNHLSMCLRIQAVDPDGWNLLSDDAKGIIESEGLDDRARYQLQDSSGQVFGPVCPVWHDEAAVMNRELARDGFDYRWSLL